MKLFYVFIIFSIPALSGCYGPTHLRTVVADLESTPACDTTNIYTHPRDTKKSLAGKVVVLNSKLDACDDSLFYNRKKLKAYKDL